MAQTIILSDKMAAYLQAVALKADQHNNTNIDDNGSLISKTKQRHDSAKGHNGKVDPIKDKTDIQKAKEYFLAQTSRFRSSHTNIRNYMLFILGLNTGRRVGDILKFKIGDFLMSNKKNNGAYVFRVHIGKDNDETKEQKTGKNARVAINDSCKEAITRYLDTIQDFKLDDYLFVSRNGGHLKYDQALNIYKKMANEIGLTEKGLNIGTHSARKTLGYQWMKQGENENNPVALAQLQMFYNHSSQNVTLSYTGITQEEQDNMIKSIKL